MLRRVGNSRTQVTKTETFPAPSAGWVQSGNIVTASPDQAEVLDNFFPTAQGARMRGGAAVHADIDAAVVRMFSYSSGGIEDFFAGTAADIYDVDRVVENGGVVSRGVDGHTLTTGAGWTAGFLNSGTKGAFLSSTDTASLVGGNLVVDGSFDVGVGSWVGGFDDAPNYDGSLAAIGGKGVMTVTGAGIYYWEVQSFTTVVGRRYRVGGTISNTAGGGGLYKIRVGPTGNMLFPGANTEDVQSGNGTGEVIHTATSTTTYVILQVNGSGASAEFDDISFNLVDDDRSVNDNPLTVNGTITRTAVATGAELVGYSGWSASNYLQQPYNSDFDFGTGDFYLMGWVKDAAVSDPFLDNRGAGFNDGFQIGLNGSNLRLLIAKAGNTSVTGSADLTTAGWRFVAAVVSATGTDIKLYVDGEVDATATVTAKSLGGTANNPTVFGNGAGYTTPMSGSMALWRIGASAPTAEQIAEIYEKELVLFQENAAITDLTTSNDFSEVEGLSSGDWTHAQIATAGGQFMVCANGSDYVHYWDGTNWNPITDEAIFDLSFDDETASFAVGQTLTGGTSGATAEIHGITKTSNTAGTLRLGAITGTFQDNEAITDGLTGSATANGVSSAGSTVAITGVDTSTLSQVWNFKERLFFVEKDTANIWYLPTESIGGAATEFPLGSVFALGGSVLFGATWSLDSGSGLDDVCLFVSSEGEIAVYEGSNPNSVTTWSLVGVYKIGKPLNKHGFFAAGGDLAIMTEDGIIPVSEALKKDRAALQAVAVSYPIEDAWKSAIANRTVEYPISVTLWQSQTLLLVGTPAKVGGRNVSFAANARTGAWSRVTGWDVRCSHVVGDQLYFANEVGKIFEADSGGQDDGASYTAVYVGKFSPSDQVRAANTVGITYRCTADVNLILDAMADYNVEGIETPAPIAEGAFSTWGSGVWGTFVWGDTGSLSTFTTWQSAYAVGYSLAPAVAMTSNQTGKPTVEILMTRVRSERGYAM